MTYKSSYVKDVERYFLSLRGCGVMLSSKDYDLIFSWKKKGVPKEVVLKGIRRAFSEGLGGGQKSNAKFSPSLNQVADFVEEAIRRYQIIEEGKSAAESGSDKRKVIQRAVERLGKIIASEKRSGIRKHYVRARKRVLSLVDRGDEDVFKIMDRIEEDFYEFFFGTLPKTERDKVMLETEQRVSKRVRFMTEKARRESVLSFRNEILKREYKLKDIATDN